jgi:hypothetical protein
MLQRSYVASRNATRAMMNTQQVWKIQVVADVFMWICDALCAGDINTQFFGVLNWSG